MFSAELDSGLPASNPWIASVMSMVTDDNNEESVPLGIEDKDV